VDTEHGSVTFSGDTAPSTNLIKLARGTDLLLQEAGFIEDFAERGASPEAMELFRTTHTDIVESGRIAREANARSRALRDSCKQAGYRGDQHVARDGEDIPLVG
jgi:ribonuclease BN (tRNA processing enzyme)